MRIRRLSPTDAPEYRRLRLLGLRERPAAFGSDHAEERARPLESFAERLRHSPRKWTFGAFEKERLVGVVTVFGESRIKERHKGSIVGMYVHKTARKRGVGRQLFRRALAAARDMRGLRQVRLAVVEGNLAARKLYDSEGFLAYGCEEAALRVGGRYHSELFMVLRLRRAKRIATRSA